MEGLREALEREQGRPRDLGPAPDPFGLWCVQRGLPRHLAAAASWYYHVTRSFLDLRFAGAERFLRVRYEDLLVDPGAIMRRVLEFMGLAESGGVQEAIGRVSNAPGPPGDLGFSTTQAPGGARLGRFATDLPAGIRTAVAALLDVPMRLLGYTPDPKPDPAVFRTACVELGIDAELWCDRVVSETAWFETQLNVFAPERLLREPDEPSLKSRPLLVEGAAVGTSRRLVDGSFIEGTSFVAKQDRLFEFADRDCKWPAVVTAFDGRLTVEQIQERFALDSDSRLVVAELHGRGFVGYA
jgi:hypothetical protein